MNIQERYDEVERFNEIAGNLNNVTVDKLEAQMKVVLEEVKELQDAFEGQNSLELLDGACDSFVTLMGLLQQMNKAGFKVDEAIKRVNENNLSKFPTHITYAAKQEYDAKGWHQFFDTDYRKWVLKDENGKIRKPIGFEPVDIQDFLPYDFFGVAA